MIPLPTLLLFLYIFLPNILPIFLYDFIGISLENVGGMGYCVCMWCYGLVMVGSGWYIMDTTAVTGKCSACTRDLVDVPCWHRYSARNAGGAKLCSPRENISRCLEGSIAVKARRERARDGK